jgi:Arc/MetJ-type ribon-helix-helix transcriptional regulator
MSIQVATRLSDDVVAFIDEQVERGEAPSRAAWLSRAARREQRHQLAMRDARIYAEHGEDSDLIGLVDWVVAHPIDPDA